MSLLSERFWTARFPFSVGTEKFPKSGVLHPNSAPDPERRWGVSPIWATLWLCLWGVFSRERFLNGIDRVGVYKVQSGGN